MARDLTQPEGWVQDDSQAWWRELDEALLNGILGKAEDFAKGYDLDGSQMPTEDDFRRATLALRRVRKIAQDLRKGRQNGNA